MCPNCQAPFVAPPGPGGPPNIAFAAQPVVPNIDFASQTPDSAAKPRRPWWPVILCLGLAVCGLFGVMVSVLSMTRANPTTAAALAPQQSLLQIETPQKQIPIATATGAEPDQGIFHVESQAQRPPVIAIANGSTLSFRLQLENQGGAIQTVWISPRSEKDIAVPAGLYQAMIDAPSNRAIQSASGRVQVKDFHHYEADFFIGSAAQHQTFYIGD